MSSLIATFMISFTASVTANVLMLLVERWINSKND